MVEVTANEESYMVINIPPERVPDEEEMLDEYEADNRDFEEEIDEAEAAEDAFEVEEE